MNQPNIQPVGQAAQQVQPSLPPPSEPGFMSQNPADIEFAFDEASGNFTIVQKQAAQPVEQPTVVSDDLRFQGAVEDANTQTITQPNPIEEKIGKLENTILQMGQIVQSLLQNPNLNNLRQQQQQEPEPQEIDLSDPQSLVALINNAVEKAVNTKLSPHLGTMDEVKLRMEYNNAAYKFGQDFITLTPAMAEIKKSDPNVPWETIFTAMQAGLRLSNNGKSTNSDSTIQTGNGSVLNDRKPQPAQTLINKAAALTTENGGQPRAIVNEQPKIRTVEDAWNKAWDDLTK